MVQAKITSKGQVTIPKKIRELLRLGAGDRIEFVVTGTQEATIRPITKAVDEIYCLLKKKHQKPLTTEEMRRAARAHVGRKRS